jgi:GxxExxY protein
MVAVPAYADDVLSASSQIHSDESGISVASWAFETQKPLSLIYDGTKMECAYRADLVIEQVVLIEMKALEAIAPVHMRQLRTYTRLADCYVGLLLNFGAPTMKQGIKRVVNGFPEN